MIKLKEIKFDIFKSLFTGDTSKFDDYKKFWNYICPIKNLNLSELKIMANANKILANTKKTILISPLAAFTGGIIDQEITKATEKNIPIERWLIIDFFEFVAFL